MQMYIWGLQPHAWGGWLETNGPISFAPMMPEQTSCEHVFYGSNRSLLRLLHLPLTILFGFLLEWRSPNGCLCTPCYFEETLP